jgi:hypothetical protein
LMPFKSRSIRRCNFHELATAEMNFAGHRGDVSSDLWYSPWSSLNTIPRPAAVCR